MANARTDSDPSPHGVLRGCRPNRIGDHAPRLPVIPRELDPVSRRDVCRVSARDDSVGCDVLPFGPQLTELPVLPGLAAVERQAPTVADCAVPDLATRSEPERVHEVPGDRMSAGIGGRPNALPLPTPHSPPSKTKIPCPYVPTQIALSGARAIASTCTPQPDESGSGGICCPASGDTASNDTTTHDARRTISLEPSTPSEAV